MSVDEPIDQVTATGNFVAKVGRNTIHTEGLWHQVFHCLIIRPELSPTVVLQRRADSAKSFPARLDLSATGHLLAGEMPIEGIRELNEELGIEVDPDDLSYLGTRLLADDSPHQKNRERIHVYLLKDHRPLEQYNPEPTEVQSLVEVPINRLSRLLSDKARSITAAEWRPQPDDNSAITADSTTREIEVHVTDLVDQVDGYWQVLMIMAERFANGVSPLAI